MPLEVAGAVLAVAFYLLLCRWFRQSHLEYAALDDEDIKGHFVLAFGAGRGRALVNVLLVKIVKIEIDRAPKPVLIEMPAFRTLHRNVFYGRSHGTPDQPDER